MFNDKNKLEILFWLKKQKTLKSGLIPIYCRITINKQRCNNGFSTGLKVFEKDFNKSTGRVLDSDPCADAHNDVLVHIENEVRNLRMLFEKNNILANKKIFFEAYKKGFEQVINDKPQNKTIEEVFNDFILHQQKRYESGIITKKTVQRYCSLQKHFFEFLITEKLNKETPIKNIVRGLFEKFKTFLFGKDFKNNYVSKVLSNLKRVFEYATDNDFLEKNPFKNLSLKTVKTKKIKLSQKELEILEDKNFEIQRLQRVKDMFLLCCYTGLSFADVQNISKDKIKEIEGRNYFVFEREKSKVTFVAPIFEKATAILEKYNYLLKLPSNEKFNAYLKEIQVICGIEKNLTSHVGRKTFINIMLNKKKLPLETISKAVGHANIKTTFAYYAEVEEEKVANDFKNISI